MFGQKSHLLLIVINFDNTFRGNTLRSKPAPVLEGSTCINCLGHYNDTKKNTPESCRFVKCMNYTCHINLADRFIK